LNCTHHAPIVKRDIMGGFVVRFKKSKLHALQMLDTGAFQRIGRYTLNYHK